MSHNHLKFYINGQWVDPVTPRTLDVINPSTEAVITQISLGSSADVDAAVSAARAAFDNWSQSSREERLALLEKILAIYTERSEEVAQAISQEMGAPIALARTAQVGMGFGHLQQTIQILKNFQFEHSLNDSSKVVYEAAGVVGMITPWNWPINQIMCKVIPALAAGCTMVLKPSEVAPLNALVVAEILHAAEVPAGVFNLVNGEGPTVGAAMSAHPGIDMMSFTGSTRGGIAVAKAAADTVKRVTQELGGKSANIVLDDADLEKAVTQGVGMCFLNSGQSCNAPTRMLVPRALHTRAVAAAKAAAEATCVDDADKDGPHIGPVVSDVQWRKIQALIEAGIAEGATLVAGGTGLPEGKTRGYFVRPTIFADVRNDMRIAREEIFGPVLVILPYDSEEEAIQITNDTPYGLAGYVQSGNREHALKVAARLRVGSVHFNGALPDLAAPFGGYKQSGTGREWGEHGFKEFLEAKSLIGCQ